MSRLARTLTRSAAAATLLVSSLAAQAAVEPGYWAIGPRADDGTQSLMVYQNASSSNSYGVRTIYNAQTGTLALGAPTLGAPASLFLMTPGQVLGADEPGAGDDGGVGRRGAGEGEQASREAGRCCHEDP